MSNDYRPRLPKIRKHEMEKEITYNENNKPLYKIAGCTSKNEFVNRAVQEKIEREKEEIKQSDNVDNMLTGGDDYTNKDSDETDSESRWDNKSDHF